ncbi:uncharacterized protein LOC141600486 [Silene latifolia]|uniref:uncharacterized protein LOC141600486 n=1 Tax=Silene latifolia TaxID=37657 RepID=UPI003D78A012
MYEINQYECKTSRAALSQPPEGPNSGYLVIEDDKPASNSYFKSYKNPGTIIKGLPFPQNKGLSIEYQDDEYTYQSKVYLIPVINQPLSSNLYYVIQADGKHQGIVPISNGNNIVTGREYQIFEFSVTKTPDNTALFLAKSVANDGHPPKLLRNKYGRKINCNTTNSFTLKHVYGLNPFLRAQLPEFNFPMSQQWSKPLVVGTWYCPFMFIMEGSEKERVKNSVFYEMTLEQRWERVFSVDNNNGYGDEKKVTVDVVVQTEVVRIGGEAAVRAYGSMDKEVVWFKSRDKEVGLSKLIMDRIIWEEERVGWVKGNQEKELRIIKEEVYEGVNGWMSFGCYVLVESFVFDGAYSAPLTKSTY